MSETVSKKRKSHKRAAFQDKQGYFHENCGQVTSIKGSGCSALLNPYTFKLFVYCPSCEKRVSLSNVRWLDSGESISEYRRRVRSESPISMKITWIVLNLLLPLTVGYFVWMLPIHEPELLAISTALLLYLFSAYLLFPRLPKLIWGKSYHDIKLSTPVSNY